ncbi:thiol-disulfide oxidoreductase DCC family protein [Fredinandcohnia humi]
MSDIILFDGICNFCNSSVQFIINRDSKGRYQFASLQSNIAKELLKKHEIKDNLDTFVLIEGDRYYTKSSAALRICRHLKGMYPLLSLFTVIPTPVRDVFYNIISKNRYKWFGKQESCMLPSPEIRKRFLD